MAFSETYGALLFGSLFASLVSGMLVVQCIIYWKVYKRDSWRLKSLVGVVWLLDILHNVAVWSAIWTWFIEDFGAPEKLDAIPKGIPLSVIATAVLTLLVHCFFAYRIYNLMKQRLVIVIPIMILALLRLASALATSYFMLDKPSFDAFKARVRWIFSLGLGLSSGVDILITIAMMFILKNSRSRSMSMGIVIDSLIVYTLENGAITTAATIVSMICWLTMNNLIFLALHFVIAKLYANSLLAMLNYREGLREQHLGSTEAGVISLGFVPSTSSRSLSRHMSMKVKPPPPTLQVNVDKSVELHVDKSPSRPVQVHVETVDERDGESIV